MQLALFHEDTIFFNSNSEDYHECPICKGVKHKSEYYTQTLILKEPKLKVSEGCKPCYQEKVSLVRQLHKEAPPKPDTCDCCGRNFKEYGLIPELDHCHTKKVFNGWLCAQCNGGLGRFEDSLERLEKAVEYVRKTNER